MSSIKKQYFERITVTGNKEHIKREIERYSQQKYSIIRSGPKPLSGHRVSASEFMIIAEKEIEKPY